MSEETQNKSSKRILIVEDEPGVRQILSLLLRGDGHTVAEAQNAEEACLMYAPGDFDLVITDYAMPGMKGDELARTIKCLVPSQPILMLTAFAPDVCRPENPVDAVLEKPFTLLALRQLMALLMSGKPAASLESGRSVNANG